MYQSKVVPNFGSLCSDCIYTMQQEQRATTHQLTRSHTFIFLFWSSSEKLAEHSAASLSKLLFPVSATSNGGGAITPPPVAKVAGAFRALGGWEGQVWAGEWVEGGDGGALMRPLSERIRGESVFFASVLEVALWKDWHSLEVVEKVKKFGWFWPYRGASFGKSKETWAIIMVCMLSV